MNTALLLLACAHTPQLEPTVTDLTTPPPVAAAPGFSPPTASIHTLSNGSEVWLLNKPDLPLVSMRMVIQGGSAMDASGAPGQTSLADAMLTRGAGERNASDFASEVERQALHLDIATGTVATVVYLDAHSDRLGNGLDLLRDMVRAPRFDSADLERLKEIRQGELAEATDDAKTVSSWVLQQVYYGDGHPLAHPVIGTISATEAAKVTDLRASWERRFGPNRTTFVVAGDVSGDQIVSELEKRFGDWAPADAELADIPHPKGTSGAPTMVFVDKPGTSQTALRIVMPAQAADDPTGTAADLGTIVLGGTFTSRLNRLLREEKGYTYGARARLIEYADHGILVASTSVQKEVSAPALADLIAELERFVEGVDDTELNKAMGARQTRMVEAMETRSSIAGALVHLVNVDREPSALKADLEAARAVNTDAVKAAIQGFTLDRAVIVVVGDLAEIREGIESVVPGEWQVIKTQG